MKKATLFATTVIMMIGCGQRTITPTTTYTDLYGEWINTQYTETLDKTNSAQAAHRSCETALVIINDKKLTEIINLHEGSDNYPLDSSVGGFSYVPYGKEASAVKLSNDTLCVGELKFVKNKFQSINEMVNVKLFVGKYTLPNGTEIEFLQDGTLKGIDGFNSYYITYDCTGTQYDLIQLKGPSGPLDLNFVIKPTEIVLFSVEFEDPESGFGTIVKDEHTRLTKK